MDFSEGNNSAFLALERGKWKNDWWNSLLLLLELYVFEFASS